MAARHEIEVRYGEVDLQRVVFNAHYLAYIDHAMDRWMRQLDADFESLGWDFMLKRADLVWSGGAGLGDTIVVDSRVASWGRTSFTIRHVLSVDGREVVTADVTYVGVDTGTTRPVPVPDAIRRHLGDAS